MEGTESIFVDTFKPDVVIFDKTMGNECCAAIIFSLDAVLMPVDRASKWELPSHALSVLKDKNVLIIGTYSESNIEFVKGCAKDYRVFVYSEKQLDRSDKSVHFPEGVSAYAWSIVGLTREDSKMYFISKAFDMNQSWHDAPINRGLLQAVKSIKADTLFTKISTAFTSNESIDDLVRRGTIELEVTDSVIRHWYEQSFTGMIDEQLCIIGHANPFIVDAGKYFLRKNTEAKLAVLYRIEKTAFRFTIISRNPEKLAACDFAKRRGGGGGGGDYQAGFQMSFKDGSEFLSVLSASIVLNI